MNCKYCNKSFTNKGSLVNHIKSCNKVKHNETEIVDLYLSGKSIHKLAEKFSLGKSTIHNFLKNKNVCRTTSESAKLAHKLYPESFKHSEESKQKMREKRLEWMKNNPEKTAWRQANLSYPEKLFLKGIQERELDEKCLIVREKSFFPYFADFTIENFKLVVEIDGSQHLESERKKKDEDKEKVIIDSGYKIIRFTENEIKENLTECFNVIDDFIKNNKNYDNITRVGIFKNVDIKYYCECGNEMYKTSKCCIKCSRIKKSLSQRKVERPSYNQLLKEIKELGYSGTGRKYGVSDNSIRKWKKFYEKI